MIVHTAAPGDDGAAPGTFKFEKRNTRLDWRLLHSLDVDRIVRETDLDTLESALETVAFGDVSMEDPRNLTEGNHRKLFRLAQLLVGMGNRLSLVDKG